MGLLSILRKGDEVGMSDLIPRDKAIECVWKPKVKPDAEIFNALKMAIQSEIEQLPIVTPEPGWISVKNKLPCDYESVLVAHSQGVTIAWYNGFYWEHGAASKHKSIKTVKAWMPLPLPPEE